MKKKGDITTGTVVVLILLVLTAIVLISVISVFNSGMAGSVSDVVCAFSVRLSVKTQILELFSIFPMACYERKIELVEGNKEKVMEQIADLMATCWWMHMEGKHKGFISTEFKPFIRNWKGYTFDCYVIDNIKITDKEGITYDEFYKFLTERGNWDKGKSVDSYYNYFESASSGESNICLDERIFKDDSYIKNQFIFSEDGKPIYIKFHDNKEDDRIILTNELTQGSDCIAVNRVVK